MSQPSPQELPEGTPPVGVPVTEDEGGADGDAEAEDPTAGPPRPSGPLLGRVALVVGVVTLLGSVVNALIVVALLDPGTVDAGRGEGSIAVTIGFVLAAALLLWFGFGLWAIVQGIVAIVQRRGTGAGIAGLSLGLIGPWVGVVIAIATLTQAWANT